MPIPSTMSTEVVDGQWLIQRLRRTDSTVLVVDCRAPQEFHKTRIRQSINLWFPNLVLKRIANGRLNIEKAIKSSNYKEKFSDACHLRTIVVLDDQGSFVHTPSSDSTANILLRRLKKDGCRVVSLEGGFESFQSNFREWCEVETDPELPLMTLADLRLGDYEPVSHPDPDPVADNGEWPVEIIPYLFLGTAENSGDVDSLNLHGIRYIINVTSNLPNVFEKCPSFKYLKIPISDHWSQNLATFFAEAFAFIEEGRQEKKGVLIHCLAGVSRSVTLTLAYLMYKNTMTLNDAYDFVKMRKENISPNFNFMGQLMDFEKQLMCSSNSGSCSCESGNSGSCRCQQTFFLSPTRLEPPGSSGSSASTASSPEAHSER